MTRRGRPSEEEEKQEEVIQNDLKKFEGELYDKLTDMDLNYRNYTQVWHRSHVFSHIM
jgi:hypothetical protein